jgi:hypothetical protein
MTTPYWAPGRSSPTDMQGDQRGMGEWGEACRRASLSLPPVAIDHDRRARALRASTRPNLIRSIRSMSDGIGPGAQIPVILAKVDFGSTPDLSTPLPTRELDHDGLLCVVRTGP